MENINEFDEFPVDSEAVLKYPSRRPENANFTTYWEKFIEDVSSRENFKVNHLEQLIILCDLYVEYERLSAEIIIDGYIKENGEGGRNGIQFKPNPMVAMLNNTRAEIRNYSKMLGLLLVKDTAGGDNTKEEDKKWK